MIEICLRTVIIYFFLIITMRLMGKRQVGELEVSELIVTFMLSEIAVNPIINKKATIFHAAVPIALLLGIEVLISILLMRFPALKRLITGKPSMIIENGILDRKELQKQRMCLSELIGALRQQGVGDIADVQFAILEENGKLSVFPKASRAGATPNQLGIEVDDGGIAMSLIIDGIIIKSNLKGKWNYEKLQRELSKRKLAASDVFLFSVSPDGSIYIMMKDS